MAATGSVMALGSLGASVWGSSSASKAAKKGQKRAMRHDLAMFLRRKEMMQPYLDAGVQALGQQSAFLGLDGPEAQQAQIDMVQNSPMFQSMLSQGEDSLLQNAAATGGIRGGNTQAALAQFSPQLLNQQLNQQYERLSGMTAMGQRSAAGVGADNAATSARVSQNFQNMGNIGAARSMGMANGVNQAIGTFGQAAMLGKLMNQPSTLGTTQNTYGVLQAQQAPGPSFGANPGSFGAYGPGFI